MYNRWRNGRSYTVYRGVWKPSYQPELYHYGVKGMRWGHHKAGPSVALNGSGGGFLDGPEYPQYDGPTMEDVAAGRATLEEYKMASQKYDQAVAEYQRARKEYEKSAAYALKHPIEAIKKAKDRFEDYIGLTDRHDTKAYKYMFEQASKWGGEAAERAKAKYEQQRAKYYKTPIGKVEKYIDAGKEAVEAFKRYTRSN